MAWTDGVDKSTGDIVTASVWNSYFGNSGNINLTAPYLAAAAGDVFYATGSKVLAKLSAGSAYTYLQTNTSTDAPEWAASPASLLDAKGEVLSASAANTPVALAAGTNDYVLTADSSTASGLKWAAASGGTTPAQMESAPMMQCDSLFNDQSFAQANTANRIYLSPLQPVGVSTTIGDFVCEVTTSTGNYILGLYSFDGTTWTKVGSDTGSTAVPSVANPAVLTGLSETMAVGTRYYYGFIASAASAFRLKYDGLTSVNYSYYIDNGSFALPSTIAKSGVTANYGNAVSGFFEVTNGLIADS